MALNRDGVVQSIAQGGSSRNRTAGDSSPQPLQRGVGVGLERLAIDIAERGVGAAVRQQQAQVLRLAEAFGGAFVERVRRVEVREADGSTYVDVATPTESSGTAPAEPAPAPSTPALAGAGFQPREEVALAYVVVRQNADAEGNASLNLPPALLASTRSGLVLLGMSSGTVTPFKAPA